MYDKTFSSAQMNGYVAGPFPIKCSVRQGCPISTLLLTLVMNPPMSVRATSHGHQNWTSDNENRCGGIHRRSHGFCYGTSRYSNNPGPSFALRKGNGCLFEHPKIQSHGGRLMGHIDKYSERPLLSGHNHTWFRIYVRGSLLRYLTCLRVTGKMKALAKDA